MTEAEAVWGKKVVSTSAAAEADSKEDTDVVGPLAGDMEDRVLGFQKVLVDSLAAYRVADLKIVRTPVVLDAELPVKSAIKILCEQKLRCAPVRSLEVWQGVLDVRDSLKYAVEAYRTAHLAERTHDEEQMDAYLTEAVHKATESLGYLARMRPFNAIYESEPLVEMLKLLSKGAHIVSVVRRMADGGLIFKGIQIGILSQGEVFRQLKQYIEPLYKALATSDVTMAELMEAKLISSPVITIRDTAAAHTAFEKMSRKGLSGLAVVDESGKLVYNTSSTDIKLWLASSATLDLSIEDFLVKIRQTSAIESPVTVFPVSYVSTTDTLSRAIEKLYRTGYHRLWVVDADTKPIAVVSITDIFKIFHYKKR